jgi:polyisoprenyl-phosphate glycosyltransferase
MVFQRAQMARLWIISPLYFDIESYARLESDLAAVLRGSPLERRLVAVDDSAGLDPAVATLGAAVRVVVPPFNLGHQRALVFALRTLAPEMADDDVVVTLDGDGEDQPTDLPRLLAPLLADPGNLRRIALAARTRRHETPLFKILYFLFKHFFLLLSGTVVRSGNYAAYRGWVARNVLFHPHFDLCYSSGLLSLNLQIERVPCERGRRYAGASKMTWSTLLLHGFRMLMPFADRIAVRGMVAAGCAGFAVTLLVLARLLGAALIDGWVLALGATLSAVAFGTSLLLLMSFAQSQGLAMSRLHDDGAR